MVCHALFSMPSQTSVIVEAGRGDQDTRLAGQRAVRASYATLCGYSLTKCLCRSSFVGTRYLCVYTDFATLYMVRANPLTLRFHDPGIVSAFRYCASPSARRWFEISAEAQST